MRAVGIAVALVLAAAAPMTPGRPAGGPTGNAAAIAYYRTVTNNLNSKPVDAQVYGGAYYLGYTANSWYLSWSVPHRRYSWQRPVVEDSVYVVAHHKIVWGTTTWLPSCPAGRVCVSTLTPLRFFFEHGASYWAFLNGRRGAVGCWNRAAGATAWINRDFNATGSQPWYVGNSPSTTPPHYGPIVHHGNMVMITSTYAFLHGARATEIDTINPATKLFTRSVVHVAPFKGTSGYSYTGTISLPSRTPSRPHLKLCG